MFYIRNQNQHEHSSILALLYVVKHYDIQNFTFTITEMVVVMLRLAKDSQNKKCLHYL